MLFLICGFVRCGGLEEMALRRERDKLVAEQDDLNSAS